jgi:hypothetical protein
MGRTGPVFIDPSKIASLHPAAEDGFTWVTLDINTPTKPYLVKGTPDEVFDLLGQPGPAALVPVKETPPQQKLGPSQ